MFLGISGSNCYSIRKYSPPVEAFYLKKRRRRSKQGHVCGGRWKVSMRVYSQTNCELCQQWLGWRGRRAEGCGSCGKRSAERGKKDFHKIRHGDGVDWKVKGETHLCAWFLPPGLCVSTRSWRHAPYFKKKSDSRESLDELQCSQHSADISMPQLFLSCPVVDGQARIQPSDIGGWHHSPQGWVSTLLTQVDTWRCTVWHLGKVWFLSCRTNTFMVNFLLLFLLLF